MCPICRSHRTQDYAVVGYGSQPAGVAFFPVLRCRRHGVEFADALPRPQTDAVCAASLDNLYGVASEPQERYVDFMDRVERIAGRQAGGVLHDVGCGNGQLLLEARRRGWRVQGNDIVSSVKARLDQHGVACRVGGLADLDVEPDSCDVVTSFCVLPHHLIDPAADMQTARRMLKPGGWLVLQLPVDGMYRKAAKGIYNAYWPGRPTRLARHVLGNVYGPGGHQFAYSRANLLEYLRACGFGEVVLEPYVLPARFSVARFKSRPLWFRVTAGFAVRTLNYASVLFRLPNHAIAFAQKPR